MRAFRTNHQNLNLLFHKLIVILAQLRHVPSAKRSHETAIEDQDYILAALEIRKTHGLTVEILQSKIRCFLVDGYFGHELYLFNEIGQFTLIDRRHSFLRIIHPLKYEYFIRFNRPLC
jgi:hypothetical protein